MSAYDDDAGRLAEHTPETCDDPYCQICEEDKDITEGDGWDGHLDE